MNKKQYLDKRKALMDEAQKLIDTGKAKEAEEKMQEIKDLDEQWDAIAQAEANFRALNQEPKALNPNEIQDTTATADTEEETPVAKAWASEDYKNAWAKSMMGMKLNKKEEEAYNLVNQAFTHTTENTSVVIPKTVSRGIWEMAGEMYPYFGDVTKTYVNGVLTMIQEDTSSEAKWYDEGTVVEDGKETFKEFTLKGCELARAITVSWKLKEMAIEDFLPYIQRKMAKQMGAAAGYGVTHGAGPQASSGKPEPMGTVTALEAETGTPQVVTYAHGGDPTYKDLLALRSKIKSGYSAGLKLYANTNTIWNKIAGIVDGNKRPIFVADPTAGGAYRVLGMLVKEDDSMKDGEILASNPGDGYHLNINKEMTMTPEDHVKERKTDYCGYAIMDGGVVTTKAHALLKEAAE